MKAIRYYNYGPPQVLLLEDVPLPAVGDNDVLIRVRAASVNPLDWHYMRGIPYLVRAGNGLRRPKSNALGSDMAGQVESAGPAVTRFAAGDEVYGTVPGLGSLAEYAVVPQDRVLAAKPASLTFEQAAAVPVAALTALEALRDKARLQPGQRVLVNGASGGVGTFAVQLAKALGAEVTGVCSAANVDLVRSLGADQVIGYGRDDFTRTEQRYDALIDIAGSKPLTACRRLLRPSGVFVGVGGPDKGRWLGPMSRAAGALALSPVSRQTMTFFVSNPSRDDLTELSALLLAGKVTPVIDRAYPLAEAAAAIRYLEAGHARGKVIVTS